MNAHEFLEKIKNYIENDIGGNGETIASHKLSSTIFFETTDPNDLAEYELEEIDIDILPGCGCWRGLIFKLKRTVK